MEDSCGVVAGDDAGTHGVSGGDAGHNQAVGDLKVFYSIDFQLAVDHPDTPRNQLGDYRRGSPAIRGGGPSNTNSPWR
jgi:hypothetical protein